MDLKTIRIVDLFCGPGGLSTGFELAGFEVTAAFDYDKSAVETFTCNHKNPATLLDLGKADMSSLPDADIVLGGPPCTQFSAAKSNKTRNVLSGLLLVQAFLRYVYYKKPRYWIMENVPTIQKYLPDIIPLRYIGIDEDGELEIPQKGEFVAADYGVPQKRRRYLIGKFPLPKQTHSRLSDNLDLLETTNLKPWRTLGEALEGMPRPRQQSNGIVRDPNYGFELSAEQLSDHFYDASLTEHETRSIKRAKLEHPYMGKLAWPDRLNEPARTVVATQLGRETLILNDSKHGSGKYRRATVRECATLQSFPISYQFYGSSYTSRYRQAGDAVPPLMSFAIAKEIAETLGATVKKAKPIESVEKTSPKLGAVLTQKRRKLNYHRKICVMLPQKEVRGYRAEFFVEGFSEKPVEHKGHTFFEPLWGAHLILGEGKGQTEIFKPSLSDCVALKRIAEEDPFLRKRLTGFVNGLDALLEMLPSSREVFISHVIGEHEDSPYWISEQVKSLADRFFPRDDFHDYLLDARDVFDHPKARRLRMRILIGVIAAERLCAVLNLSNRAVNRASM